MARKPKVLTRLRIDEISSVDRGAGEGVRVVLMKRHDRTPHNRFEKMFRQVDFSKIKTNPLPVDDQDPDNGDDMGDDDSKLSPQLEAHINALIVAMPTINRQQAAWFLTSTPHGRAMAQHLSATTKRKDQPMSRADGLRKIAKDFGVHKLAGLLVAGNDAHGISEHELSALAFEAAQKSRQSGERPNSCFARWYSEPAQLELRKAIQIAKNTPVEKAYPQLLDLQPTQVDGADATDVNDATKAYAQLQDMAAELRRRTPELTAAQAFARIFEDQANAVLAARAHKRPTPTTSYAMP